MRHSPNTMPPWPKYCLLYQMSLVNALCKSWQMIPQRISSRFPLASRKKSTIKYGICNKKIQRLPRLQLRPFQINFSKYPPAKPGALRLLAPQRGLTAIGQNQKPFIIHSVSLLFPSFLRKRESSVSSGFRVAFHLPGMTILFSELSNSGSPPAEPGVYLSSNHKVGVDRMCPPHPRPLPRGERGMQGG